MSRWRLGRLVSGAAAVAAGCCLAVSAAAQVSGKGYGQVESYFEDVATDVARRGLQTTSSNAGDCQNNYYGMNPCPGIIRHWREFATKFGLEDNRQNAAIFEAYINKEYRKADRLYAGAMGFSMPPDSEYWGVGKEIAALGIKPEEMYQKDCSNDPNAPNPCPGILRHWRTFLKKHGLKEDRRSAQIFQAYAQRNYRKGDRLYAAATGRSVFFTKKPHSGIGSEVATLGLGQLAQGREQDCEPNYFAPNPCPTAVRHWKAFAAKHGLALDLRSAEIFQAYVKRDFTRADRMYAAAKRMSVDQLLQSRGVTPPAQQTEPRPLVVPIWP